MKGNERVLELLNQILTHELTSVNQMFLHARMCEHWGYRRLGKRIHDESIEEMRNADRLVQRILYLDGLPNLQRLGKVNVGENVGEQLALDLDVERTAIRVMNETIEACRSAGDDGSRALLADLLGREEAHASWLETQLGLIAQLGAANYLAQQLGDGE
jgi:bacterioferritin